MPEKPVEETLFGYPASSFQSSREAGRPRGAQRIGEPKHLTEEQFAERFPVSRISPDKARRASEILNKMFPDDKALLNGSEPHPDPGSRSSRSVTPPAQPQTFGVGPTPSGYIIGADVATEPSKTTLKSAAEIAFERYAQFNVPTSPAPTLRTPSSDLRACLNVANAQAVLNIVCDYPELYFEQREEFVGPIRDNVRGIVWRLVRCVESDTAPLQRAHATCSARHHGFTEEQLDALVTWLQMSGMIVVAQSVQGWTDNREHVMVRLWEPSEAGFRLLGRDANGEDELMIQSRRRAPEVQMVSPERAGRSISLEDV